MKTGIVSAVICLALAASVRVAGAQDGGARSQTADPRNSSADPASGTADARTASADPYERIAEASAAFNEGRFDDALSAYQSAAGALGDSNALDYNRAAAKYKLGDYTGAAELFGRAALSLDPELGRRSRFAWGNCDYASALSVLRPADGGQGQPADLQSGLEKLEAAIRHYRDALAATADPPDGHPADRGARENIERAQRLIDIIKEMQEQQQQQQQQDQQEDQEQDQEQREQEQQSDGEQQEQEQEQPQEQQQEDHQPPDSEEQQEDRGQDDQEQEEQRHDRQPSEPDQSTDEQQPQKRADEQQTQQDQVQRMEDREMTPQEAEALLQATRDKEEKRRQQKLLQMRARRVPATRDW